MENYGKIKKLEKIIATCMLSFAVVLVVAVYSFIAIGKARRNNAKYDEMIATLEKKEVNLKNSVADMSTEKYLEKQARERLGMLKEGETLYIFE